MLYVGWQDISAEMHFLFIPDFQGSFYSIFSIYIYVPLKLNTKNQHSGMLYVRTCLCVYLLFLDLEELDERLQS